ncbi:MAG: helix-turn-helix transcriptional regulator [Streptomycetaceae bacterium]|nr:helix-turn-helix transcriptional regulator [Streptomycetaceae bacterium]
MRPTLTDIERDVLQGAADGETYAETSARIFITEGSVSNVATRIMRKLDARSMPQAVLLACRAGILDGKPRRHGDHAGYAAHQYRGEEPCDLCKAGERKYRNERRNKPKENAA